MSVAALTTYDGMRSDIFSKKSYLSRFLAVTILLILTISGFVLRFWLLGSVPYGLQQDEASIGYDAWCLARYGIDRNGYHWPVYPISWGSGGGSPLLDYLVVIATAVFGRSHWSLRFWPAFLGALTIPLWALASLPFLHKKEGTHAPDSPTADDGALFSFTGICILAFLTLINPWHFMLSRWTLDSNILPFFELASVMFFVMGASLEKAGDIAAYARRRRRFYTASIIFFALTVYSYGSATLVIPAALIIMAFFTIRAGRMSISELVAAIGIFILILLPLGVFFLINALHLPAIDTGFISIPVLTASRSVFHGPGELAETLPSNMRYLMHLFTTGAEEGELSCNFIPGYGQMYRYTFPLTFLGLAVSVIRLARHGRHRSSVFPAADLCFITLAVVSAIFLMFIDCDINRVTPLLVPMLYFQGTGLSFLIRQGARLIGALKAVSSEDSGKKEPQRLSGKAGIIPGLLCTVIAVAFCLLFVNDSRHFFRDYFGDMWAQQNKDVFMPGYCEAVQSAYSDAAAGGKTVVSTYARLSAPFILALYETELPPEDFLETVVWKDEQAEFRVATSFKGFSFGIEKLMKKKALTVDSLDHTVYILHKAELEELPDLQPYVTAVFDDYTVVGRK